MVLRLLLVLALALAPVQALANRDVIRDRIVAELREDGYREIRISRTLLGRMRFVASKHDARREIVVNPRTGEILRDYIRFYNSSGSNSGPRGSGKDDEYEDGYDDDDDDDDDYDDSDDDGDDSDNSGSGSSNSGSGSSNSGSGSSSSGSGSGSDDDD